MAQVAGDAAPLDAGEAPRAPGSYLLVLHTREPLALTIGRLGALHLPAGWHVYVGSAQGGLAARLRHHRRSPRRPHWHIDYLRPHAELVEVWVAVGRQRRECALAASLATLPGARRWARFGSSDCRCASHLISLAARPPLSLLTPTLVRLQ